MKKAPVAGSIIGFLVGGGLGFAAVAGGSHSQTTMRRTMLSFTAFSIVRWRLWSGASSAA